MTFIQVIFYSVVLVLGLVYFGYYFLCCYTVKHKSLKIKKKKNFRPTVSIVIPTWNEENTIEGKLKNILKLKYPKKKLEIIVIDSGSTDNTKKIVKKFKKVKLIAEKRRKGKAKALNKVIKKCRGEIIVISDADCRLKKDILIKSMPYFYDSSLGALTGKQELINPKENLAPKIEQKYRDFYYLLRKAESIIDSTFIFHGEFTAFRKNLIKNIFEDSVADDSEIALRIRKKGFRTILLPEAKHWEYAPLKLSERVKQKYRRAQGLVQIMSRFFSTFFMKPEYGYFGLIIFPTEFFMHVISPFLIVVTLITMFFLPFNLLILMLLGIGGALLIRRTRIFLLTFLHSQYSCLKGMIFYLFKGPSHNWEKIQGTRRYKK